MSSWIPFFKAKDKETKNVVESFEKDLKKISLDIKRASSQQEHLSKQAIAVKRKLVIYAVITYTAFLIYVFAILGYKQVNAWEYAAIVAIPFTVHFVKNFLSLIYNKWVYRLRDQIEKLKQDHALKINELKEMTNFNKTQDLLLKFTDDAEDLEAKRQQQAEFFEKLELQNNLNAASGSSSQNITARRTFFDRIASMVIGDDEMGPQNRFALICQNCMMHNGLAPPGVNAIDVKYICPHCGTINNKTEKDEPSAKEETRREEDEELANIEEVDGSTAIQIQDL